MTEGGVAGTVVFYGRVPNAQGGARAGDRLRSGLALPQCGHDKRGPLTCLHPLIETDRERRGLLTVDRHWLPSGKLGERDRRNDEDEKGDVEQSQVNSTGFQTEISSVHRQPAGQS